MLRRIGARVRRWVSQQDDEDLAVVAGLAVLNTVLMAAMAVVLNVVE